MKPFESSPDNFRQVYNLTSVKDKIKESPARFLKHRNSNYINKTKMASPYTELKTFKVDEKDIDFNTIQGALDIQSKKVVNITRDSYKN